MMMSISLALSRLGLSQKEIDVFLACYKLGTTPASTIAKHLRLLRTTTYTILLKLVDEHLVSLTTKNKVAYFFVPDERVLRRYIDHKIAEIQSLSSALDSIEQELSALRLSRSPHFPKIHIFDASDGIKNIYRDMLDTISEHKYLGISFVGSNTYDLQIASATHLSLYASDFFATLEQQHIRVEGYIANGTMIMEELQKTNSFGLFRALPASNAAINLFVVGTCCYLIIFYDIPIGIKIESTEFATMMQFVLSQTGTKS